MLDCAGDPAGSEVDKEEELSYSPCPPPGKNLAGKQKSFAGARVGTLVDESVFGSCEDGAERPEVPRSDNSSSLDDSPPASIMTSELRGERWLVGVRGNTAFAENN